MYNTTIQANNPSMFSPQDHAIDIALSKNITKISISKRFKLSSESSIFSMVKTETMRTLLSVDVDRRYTQTPLL